MIVTVCSKVLWLFTSYLHEECEIKAVWGSPIQQDFWVDGKSLKINEQISSKFGTDSLQ